MPASGVAWSEDIVATAHHVVERDEEIKVGLPDGTTVSATLVGRDPTTDLAALRIEAGGLTPPERAELDDVRVGNLALALGRPGQTVQATLGVVSALGKGWRTPSGGQIDRYFQNDAAMYPGFSGGPLVAASGQVLGINTSALLRGISVAVPVATVSRVVETLLEHGRVRRGFLGVGLQLVRLPEAAAAELGQETGLLLVSVESGSPAEKGGLLLGDTIVTVSSGPVRQLDDLMALLGPETVRATVTVRIVRGGQLSELSVAVGERTGRPGGDSSHQRGRKGPWGWHGGGPRRGE
jgi:S1-C subfamily serine protease